MTNDDKQLIEDIAVICGIECKYITQNMDRISIDNKGNMYTNFSPLANTIEAKAFCWDLMVKYDGDFISPYKKNNETIYEVMLFNRDGSGALSYYDDDPQRALLLAVRELNKDKLNP